jgi:squalene synthase HpnC
MPVDHYENFPVASWLLPHRLREPVSAIYGYARSADDIADEGEFDDQERLSRLDRYRGELAKLASGTASEDAIFLCLSAAIAKHDLPLAPFSDLLDAFSQDVVKKRYADFAELMDYCRRSANPVGRLLLRLYRAESEEQLKWSDAICSSLQLINHWQDVSLDLARGRIYLPQEDLARFAVTEAQLISGRVDENWRALMRFEVDRARTMMLSGAPRARSLPGRIGLELKLIVAGGLRILEKIEAAGYDVFRRRPVLTLLDWPLLLGRALWP